MKLCRKWSMRLPAVLLVSMLPAVCVAEVYVTRDEIVQRLKPKISVQLRRGDATDEERQRILDSLKLEIWSKDVLPEKFEVRKETHKQMILNSYNCIISYDNAEYIELAIKSTLMNVGLRCHASRLSPVLPEEDKSKIETGVRDICEGVRSSLLNHLAEHIPGHKIDAAIDRQVSDLLRKRDEP